MFEHIEMSQRYIILANLIREHTIKRLIISAYRNLTDGKDGVSVVSYETLSEGR